MWGTGDPRGSQIEGKGGLLLDHVSCAADGGTVRGAMLVRSALCYGGEEAPGVF